MGRLTYFAIISLLFLASCGNPGQGDSPHTNAERVAPKAITRVQTGAGPNDAILIEGATPMLVVAASMESGVQFFDLKTMASKGRVFFRPNAEARSPNPWALAASDDGDFVAVSLFDDRSVALIDTAAQKLISSTRVSNATHPTAIKFVGNDLYVAFTNLQSFADFSGTPSRYGEGILARFKLFNGALSYTESLTLPCKNPSDIVVDENTNLLVSCSGSQYFDASKNLQMHDGAGLIKVQALGNLAVLSSLRFEAFSPSKLITHHSGFFLTNALRRQILFVPRNASSESQATVISLNKDAPNETGFVSSIVKHSADLALVADFRSDQVLGLDLATRTFSPAALPSPIQLQNKEVVINKGPISLAMSDSGELFVLMAMSAEIISVDLGDLGDKK